MVHVRAENKNSCSSINGFCFSSAVTWKISQTKKSAFLEGKRENMPSISFGHAFLQGAKKDKQISWLSKVRAQMTSGPIAGRVAIIAR